MLAAILQALSQNQIALGAAIEELALWVEQRGSAQTAEQVRSCLKTLDDNAAVVALALSKLNPP